MDLPPQDAMPSARWSPRRAYEIVVGRPELSASAPTGPRQRVGEHVLLVARTEFPGFAPTRSLVDPTEHRVPDRIIAADDPGGPLAIAASADLLGPTTLPLVAKWLDEVLARHDPDMAIRLRAWRGEGLGALRGVERLIALRLVARGREVRACPIDAGIADRDWSLIIGACSLLTFEPVGAEDRGLAALRRLAATLGVPVDRRIVPAIATPRD